MKGLAEYVLRGRLQALIVVLIGASTMMFCWVSAAVVALVTLRKGAGEGAWLLLWALLPAGMLLVVVGDSGPLALLTGTMVLALVLRITVSLPLTILASVAVGVLTGLALVVFGSEFLDQLTAFFAEFLTRLEQQLAADGGETVVLPRPKAAQIAGMLGAANSVTVILCLLLARWWQASLYNPGGFSEEFKALRLAPAATAVLLIVGLALVALGVEYRTWAIIFMVPLSFAGLALVHARVAWRRQSSGWLTGFYLLWLVFDPVKLVVVAAAIADSWLNFRHRWNSQMGGGNDSRDDERRD